MINRRIKREVKNILEKLPEARNSDAILMIKVWEEFYSLRFPASREQFLHIIREASPETIRRTRQWFNQVPRLQFLPTEWKIAKHRGINEEQWKHYIKFEIGKQDNFYAPTAINNISEKEAIRKQDKQNITANAAVESMHRFTQPKLI